MIDLLAVGVGVVAWSVGVLTGKRRQKAKIPKEPEPICGCNHHFSMHDENGVCQSGWTDRVLVERGQPRTVQTGWNGEHHKVVYDHERWETVRKVCACRKYTGPEPLPRYVS